MKKILLIIFYILFSGLLMAQSEKKVSFSGMVRDSISNEPLEYAAIRMFDASENKFCYGAITDKRGFFVIEQIKLNDYIMIVSYLGYESKTIFVDLSLNKSINRFEILLSPDSAQLSGVEITSQRIGSTMKVDRDIFIPDSLSIKSSATGLELLDKVPGVKVSKSDQTINFMGQENVLVLIDGVGSGRNLNTINPNDVERIETMKNPTAAYDADISGIINVILKEEKKQGFQAFLLLDYFTKNRYNFSTVQLDYNFDKFRVFGMYRIRLSNSSRTDSSYYRNIENDRLYEYIRTNPEAISLYSLTHAFQYGADYRINSRNLLNFTGQFEFGKRENDIRQQGLYCLDNKLIEKSNIQNDNDNELKSQNYNIYYRHDFGRDEQYLTVTGNFYKNRRDVSSDFEAYTYDAHDSLISQNTYQKPEINKITSGYAKIHYNQPINEYFTIDCGLQFYARFISEKQYNNAMLVDFFDYKDYKTTPYLSATYQNEKWSFQAGLRAENMMLNLFDSVKTSQWNFMPVASILYNMGKAGRLKLTYRRAFNYPSYRMLSPFIYYSGDSITATTGNPYLKPSKKSTVALEYSYRFSKNLISISSYSQFINDGFDRVQQFSEDNGFLKKWGNVAKFQIYGFYFYGEVLFFKRIKPSLDLDVYYTHFQERAYSGWSYALDFSLDVELPIDFYISVSLNFKGKSFYNNGYSSQTPSIDEISVSKKFLKGAANIQLSFINPFLKNELEESYFGDDFREYNVYEFDKFSVMLRFSYFLNKGRNSNKIRREIFMDKEEK